MTPSNLPQASGSESSKVEFIRSLIGKSYEEIQSALSPGHQVETWLDAVESSVLYLCMFYGPTQELLGMIRPSDFSTRERQEIAAKMFSGAGYPFPYDDMPGLLAELSNVGSREEASRIWNMGPWYLPDPDKMVGYVAAIFTEKEKRR